MKRIKKSRLIMIITTAMLFSLIIGNVFMYVEANFSTSMVSNEDNGETMLYEASSTVTIGGLTLTADDGKPLTLDVDYKEITETLKYFNSSGSLVSGAPVKMVGIMTSRPITISGTSTTHGVRIIAGTKANVTLDGVNISNVAMPFDVATNLLGTADGSKATAGPQIIDRTTLYLTIADNSTNTLIASTSYSFAGLHCGEGSEMVIDDAIHNMTNDGRMIIPLQGRIPFDCTLSDGKTVLKKGDPAWMMDSKSPGVLTVKGGMFSAAIGGENAEESGKININGGNITASAYSPSDGGIASAGTGIGGGCNAGVGYLSEDSGLTLNGGKILAQGSYHGAAIGAGYGNSEATKYKTANETTLKNIHIGKRDSSYTTSPVPGDITVNGGYIEAQGYDHGNAFGGACVSASNAGHVIQINGGTLKPTSKCTTSSYNIGAFGGTVVVTGGSFPIQAQTSGGKNGLSFEGTGVYSADLKTELTMVKIDLSSYDGLKAGDKLLSYNVLVDGKPLASDYGLANQVDTDMQLYFWIPASAVGKPVTIAEVKLMDEDGNIIDTEYPFTLPEAGSDKDNVTKRYVSFEVDTDLFSNDLKKLINKRYDGLPFNYDLLKSEIIKQNIEVPQPKGERIDQIDDLDMSSVRVSDKDGELVDDESSKEAFSETGNYNITVNYNEFKDDANFSKTFWGHQTVLKSTITPADTTIFNANYDVTYYTDSENQRQVDSMTLRASVRPKDGEALTCAAPEGYIQFYINGVKVGQPQKVVKAIRILRTNVDSQGYDYSNASVTLQFRGNDNYPKVPDMKVFDEDTEDTFIVTAKYYDGTNYTDSIGRVSALVLEDEEPENFPFVTPPITVVTPTDPNDVGPDEELEGDYRKPDKVELEEEDGKTILHSYVNDELNASVEKDKTKQKDELIKMMNHRYGFANANNTVVQVGDKALIITDITIIDDEGTELSQIDLSQDAHYILETTVEDKDGNKTTIQLNYRVHDLMKDDTVNDVDTDGDGFPDVNVDVDGDGKPDINIDVDKDGKPDVNIDTDGDDKPDINIDTDGDKKPDINVDTDGDDKPDVNIVDKDKDGKPDDLDKLTPDEIKDLTPDVNIDKDGDGKPDINIDTNGDGKPDINIDTNGDGKADINIDTDGDGKPNINIDKDGDGIADVNIDINGDGIPDLNIEGILDTSDRTDLFAYACSTLFAVIAFVLFKRKEENN